MSNLEDTEGESNQAIRCAEDIIEFCRHHVSDSLVSVGNVKEIRYN